MSIRFAHSIDVPQTPAQAFALLDDVSQTPRWLSRCTGVEQLTPGALAVGTRLRYGYREGSRSGAMEGVVAARTPDAHLRYEYGDGMVAVTVEFHIARTGAGTRITHSVEIAPRTLVARLFSPLIRRALPGQTVEAMEALRRLLAAR